MAKVPSSDLSEVTFTKLSLETSLGLTLAQVSGEPQESGVVVTAMTTTIAHMGATDFGPGCIIYEVVTGSSSTPTTATDYQAVSKLLKESTGEITLRFAKADLPEGWSEHLNDRKRIFYRNKEANLVSRSHPLALAIPTL